MNLNYWRNSKNKNSKYVSLIENTITNTISFFRSLKVFFKSKIIIYIITSEVCTLHKKKLREFYSLKCSEGALPPTPLRLLYRHYIFIYTYFEHLYCLRIWHLNNYIIHSYKYCSTSFYVLKRIIHSTCLMFGSMGIRSEVTAVWIIV